MSTRDHVPGMMHRDQHGNVIEDYHGCGCQPHERSAGAAPLESECDCDCHLCDCYLRHSEGTER